ncbi:MAG TPA: ferrous iron transport protein A [Verrucomicrobiae bacterium]|nr:ferrous iron transport protein A [Verrucomicrobiae bacterium]
MTLDMAKPGQKVLITAIKNPQVRAQAIRFGIAEGAEALCEQTIPAGPIVLRRNRQEIAIGRSIAKEIGVKFLA